MNNKKMIAGVLSALTALALLPGIAGAVDGTTSTTDGASSGVPEACIVPFVPFGPARAAHSPAGAEVEVPPPCEDVEGICVELVTPKPGPARIAHRTNDEAVITGVPCVPIDPACDIVVDLDITGPARAAHQPAGDDEPILIKGIYVEIPEACQEALSLAAIPDAGSDSATIMWLGAGLVGIGGALLLTRRTALARTR